MKSPLKLVFVYFLFDLITVTALKSLFQITLERKSHSLTKSISEGIYKKSTCNLFFKPKPTYIPFTSTYSIALVSLHEYYQLLTRKLNLPLV